jgi:predicted dehydrogenase
MNQPPSDPTPFSDFNRRDFLKGGSFATLMTLMGGVPLRAQDAAQPAAATALPTAPPVNCAVIGCGTWGREILQTLSRMPNAPVVAICDHYEAFLRRSAELAPKAEQFTDYKKLLAHKDVKGVIVATPSHQHKQIVLDALAAGKHVYCEAPLAHTVEDARAIAAAAKASVKTYFQAGLQMRSHPHRHFVLGFVRSGAGGKAVAARAQWNRKQSWRRTSPSPEREKEINWRLSRKTSPGLIGEVGIHSVDLVSWFADKVPLAVTGFGGVNQWKDGRDVPDTVQAVFEFPEGMNLMYEATLANSFDADYELFYGSDSAIMLRDNSGWMFKEADAPLLGWEVYARKDNFFKNEGIALIANASKTAAQGKKADEDATTELPAHYYSLEAFITNTGMHDAAVEDFISGFGDTDKAALAAYVADATKAKAPAAGWLEGYQSTVLALKANESVLTGKKITITKESLEVG